MKKIISIFSLLVVASAIAYAEASQNITANLSVTNLDDEPKLNLSSTNVNIGKIPIVAGEKNIGALVPVDASIQGVKAQTVTVIFPAKVEATGGVSGNAKAFIKVWPSAIEGVEISYASGNHTILTKNALGDGVSQTNIPKFLLRFGNDDAAPFTGNEELGVYRGSFTLTSNYN